MHSTYLTPLVKWSKLSLRNNHDRTKSTRYTLPYFTISLLFNWQLRLIEISYHKLEISDRESFSLMTNKKMAYIKVLTSIHL